MTELQQKTVVITGGTSGIGLAAAKELAQRGHRLILIGRKENRGQQALSNISPPKFGAHRFISADLSLMSGVQAAAYAVRATEERVDVLANNAGTWFQRRELTSEGLERTVAVNHLAYVGLTLGLEDLLMAAPQARVINTGSFVYKHARYDPKNLQAKKRFSTNGTYAATKLYNLMFTRALAIRWAPLGITVNCFSPGFVATNFGRGEGGWLEPYYRFIRRFASSPEKGADTLVYLADASEGAEVTGAYFEKRRPVEVKGQAADAKKNEELLEWSIYTLRKALSPAMKREID